MASLIRALQYFHLDFLDALELESSSGVNFYLFLVINIMEMMSRC